MKTTIYLMRHSQMIEKPNMIKNSDNLQFGNEKGPLSIYGEELASKVSKNQELKNIDYIISSNYVRAMATAKYIAFENNLVLNVNEDLGERKFGIDSWDELPENFEEKQFQDENYKIKNGESQLEVRNRMYQVLENVLKEHKGERIVIVSHGTALAFLLKTWCEINCKGDYKFNDKVFFDGKWNFCQTFKLEFEDDKLINIYNIKFN